jgi:hypothetical protein
MTKQKFRLEGIEGESSGEARVVDVANIYNQNSDSCGPHCTCNVECDCDVIKCDHCRCVSKAYCSCENHRECDNHTCWYDSLTPGHF